MKYQTILYKLPNNKYLLRVFTLDLEGDCSAKFYKVGCDLKLKREKKDYESSTVIGQGEGSENSFHDMVNAMFAMKIGKV